MNVLTVGATSMNRTKLLLSPYQMSQRFVPMKVFNVFSVYVNIGVHPCGLNFHLYSFFIFDVIELVIFWCWCLLLPSASKAFNAVKTSKNRFPNDKRASKCVLRKCKEKRRFRDPI